MRAGVEVLLPVGAETAWSTLLDWSRQPAWMRDAAGVRVLGERREGVGTRIAVVTEVFGVRAFTDLLEITLWQPPTRLVMAHRRFVRGTGEWRLERLGEHTRFTWVEDVSLGVPLLGSIALAAYRPALRLLMRRSLRGLQELLSSPATSVELPPPRTIA
jgi:hypothetical protein